MRLLSLKQKVFTTDCAAVHDSEDVNVEGKRYPTHALGRLIARYPNGIFLAFLLIFVFFVIGCAKIRSELSCSLDDYQIRSTIPIRRDDLKINTVLEDWSVAQSNSNNLNRMLDRSRKRSIVQDSAELHAVINLPNLIAYIKANNPSNSTPDIFGNFLTPSVFHVYHAVEQLITEQDGYKETCFTNNLRDGTFNYYFPPCAPVASISQYIYPQWNGIEWIMNGAAKRLQVDFLPRLFANPSYGWFFDSNFSAANPIARQLRSQFTFASTKGEPRKKYRRHMKKFIPNIMHRLNVEKVVQLDFADFYLGGGTTQTLLTEIASEAEGYKVGVAAAVCFVFSWWHCGAFVVGLYTVTQTMVVYMAAVGLYTVIYKTLPLTTYSAIIWVTTFCMHGTLSFYDMFVYSGIMATKGRQNNLSVAQRLCFTMRRISVGVWIADVLAIVIFAINTASLFNSVVQFSVFMIIALLWNMYCIVLSTPAFVVLHHLYFANKRRNLQKQNDVLNAAMQGCRRPEHLSILLSAVQDNAAEDEKPYWPEEDLLKVRNDAKHGSSKRACCGFADFIRVELRAGYEKIRAARHDLVGVMHKVRKTKQQVIDRVPLSEVPRPAFQLQDFMQVGDANPLADEVGAGVNGSAMYYNHRMVFPSDLIHIPPVYVERSEECWAGLCSSLGQSSRSSNGDVVPPRVCVVKQDDAVEGDAAAFAKHWREVGMRLGVETTSSNRTASLVPLAVRSAVRAHDPDMIVDTVVQAATLNPEEDAAAPLSFACGATSAAVRPTGGPSGFGLWKLRYRWRHRSDMKRTRCCGLFGRVENETPEEHMRRLMRRRVRRDGYSFFERVLVAYFLPAVYRVRYVLLALLLAMFIALCVAGSFIKAGGLPNTLIAGQEKAANYFASMDGTFGQRGNCTFCSPYYRPVKEYRQSTVVDIRGCSSIYGEQMNLYVDRCGVCNGTNACVDCAGTLNGKAVEDECGGCSVPDALTPNMCTCSVTRDCSFCDWAVSGLLVPSGGTCTKMCPPNLQCGAHGRCDQYTGECTCDAGYIGARCDVRGDHCGAHGKLDTKKTCACDAGWTGKYCNVSSRCGGRGVLLSAAQSPTGAEMCGCVGHWRGATCQVCDCLNGGMCNGVTGECECVGAFVGSRCETCAANCTRRGTCPSTARPDYSLWNVRTCIANACVQKDAAKGVNTIPETMCSACERTGMTGTATVCSPKTDRDSCMANVDCWWYTKAAGKSYCGLARVGDNLTSLSCQCKHPKIWSGETCGKCLAPSGATCQEDGTALGCNRLPYQTASAAMATDACGICGGNGLCRGCDGIPGSGTVYDACGVCGGNGDCTGARAAKPVYVDYLFDLTALSSVEDDESWCKVVSTVATALRGSDGAGSQARTVLEDYLANSSYYGIRSINDFYAYAVANGRLSETIFSLNLNKEPVELEYIRYRMESSVVNSGSSADEIVSYYYWIDKYLLGPYHQFAKSHNMSISYTSTAFQPAVARVGALQSLWFAVGVGLAVTFALLLVYYVSASMAVAATMVAAIVCFGSLTVCMMFNWEVDAVLQVCISCTVPIGVEYVVHLCSGYFDYLQTTTSHLFAKDVTRRTAVQGSLLRSASAVCTSAVAVIIISIMFVVSELTPSKRCGQIGITLHLLVLMASVLFIGAVAAVGPMKVYQHWTLSSALCIVCALLAAIAVLLMYAAKGVRGPHANKILTR